jgi:hypothetical protein
MVTVIIGYIHKAKAERTGGHIVVPGRHGGSQGAIDAHLTAADAGDGCQCAGKGSLTIFVSPLFINSAFTSMGVSPCPKA